MRPEGQACHSPRSRGQGLEYIKNGGLQGRHKLYQIPLLKKTLDMFSEGLTEEESIKRSPLVIDLEFKEFTTSPNDSPLESFSVRITEMRSSQEKDVGTSMSRHWAMT